MTAAALPEDILRVVFEAAVEPLTLAVPDQRSLERHIKSRVGILYVLSLVCWDWEVRNVGDGLCM